MQVRLEALLDFQASSRLAVRGLEVETIIVQQDLLALILPLGRRRDIRASPSATLRFELRASSFLPGDLLAHKNRDGQAHDQLKECFQRKAQTLEQLQTSMIYNDHNAVWPG